MNIIEARQTLIWLSPVFLWIILAGFLIALWLNREAIKRLLNKHVSRQQAIGLGLIGLLSFVLIRGVAPRTHRLFFDEDIYQAIAINLAHNNHAAMNNDGRWEYGNFRSLNEEFNKQPNGWPFLISLGYRLFGVSEEVGFTLANLLFLVSIALIFFTGILLFKDTPAALLAALLYGLMPENLRWFSTMDGDPATACMTLLGMAATLLFIHSPSRSSLFLLVTSWAFALQFRFESVLLALLVFAMLYQDAWEEFKTPRLYGFIVLLVALLGSHVWHYVTIQHETWGSTGGGKLGWEYFQNNFWVNTTYYLNGKKFPILFTALALGGAFFPGNSKSKFYVGMWFLLSWGVFLFFYAGSYNYGVDVRYALLSFAPLALFAGRGASQAIAVWQKKVPGSFPTFMMLFLILGSTLIHLPYVRAIGIETWQCRADHDAAERFAALVPDDGIVLTHNPNMFQVFGKNAAQLSLFTPQNSYGDQRLRPDFKDKIYMHWNYWCNTQDPMQVKFCTDTMDAYPRVLIAEEKVRDQYYALYRVLGPNEKVVKGR